MKKKRYSSGGGRGVLICRRPRKTPGKQSRTHPEWQTREQGGDNRRDGLIPWTETKESRGILKLNAFVKKSLSHR